MVGAGERTSEVADDTGRNGQPKAQAENNTATKKVGNGGIARGNGSTAQRASVASTTLSKAAIQRIFGEKRAGYHLGRNGGPVRGQNRRSTFLLAEKGVEGLKHVVDNLGEILDGSPLSACGGSGR